MMKFSRTSVLRFLKQYQNIRFNSSQATTKKLVHLNQRTLLRLAGEEVSDFLQGLITNDIKHLEEGAVSIYSVFLNIKGRVLYDTIIYKTQEAKTYYVECDSSVLNNLTKHLKMYKLRRKLDIESMEENMKVWSVFDTNVIPQDCHDRLESQSNLEGKIFPCGTNDRKSSKVVNNISMYSDPRIYELGLRVLTKSHVTSDEILKHLKPNIAVQDDLSSYRAFRYKLGVGEGIKDFPPGVSFPLEVNCDYLHGVSFHKGCYIGQELTARTHHTGVVRKRHMPLIFDDFIEPLEYDEKIRNDSGKIVGKIIGQEGKFGLGLIRIAEAMSSKTLTARDTVLKVVKPHWWPQESQKMEASIKTSKN